MCVWSVPLSVEADVSVTTMLQSLLRSLDLKAIKEKNIGHLTLKSE